MNDAGADFLLNKLVPALRSGQYDQGKGRLRTNNDLFCCLGVAANEFDDTRWVQDYAGNWAWKTRRDEGEEDHLEQYGFPYELREAFELGVDADDEFVHEAVFKVMDERRTLSPQERKRKTKPSLAYCNDILEYDFLTIADIVVDAANAYLAAREGEA